MTGLRPASGLGAGPELDRLVAEQVMGWREVQDSDYEGDEDIDTDASYNWWWSDEKSRAIYSLTDCGTRRHGHTVWQPSTNIAHAWEVVERMRTNGLHVTMDDADLPDLWTIRFERWVRGEDAIIFRGDADTAPLAICRAALAAVDQGLSHER